MLQKSIFHNYMNLFFEVLKAYWSNAKFENQGMILKNYIVLIIQIKAFHV